MENKKFVLNKIILIILCVLCVIMTGFEWASAFINGVHALNIVGGVVYLAIVYYAVFAYKRPHGNELKYIMLFTALLVSAKCLILLTSGHNSDASFANILNFSIYFVSVVLLSYVAGRLDRIKENKIIFIVIIGLVLFINIFKIIYYNNPQPEGLGEPEGFNFFGFIHKFSTFGTLVQYVAIMVAYLCRYQLHKEAGMKDK